MFEQGFKQVWLDKHTEFLRILYSIWPTSTIRSRWPTKQGHWAAASEVRAGSILSEDEYEAKRPQKDKFLPTAMEIFWFLVNSSSNKIVRSIFSSILF